MSNWSDLHHDLLVLITKRLCLIEDFVAFGSICHSWRLAAKKENFPKVGQIPWLMLAENKNEDSTMRGFYSLSHDRIYKVTLPEASGKRCFSSQGWLFTVGNDLELNLLHPLSRSRIRLPSLSDLTNFNNKYVSLSRKFFIWKVALSSSPSSTTDYVVMVIHGTMTKLAYYRAGSDAWISIETRLCTYYDVIHYEGLFYALDGQARVLVCDVNGPNPTTAKVVHTVRVGDNRWIAKLYLAESRGRLLIVSRTELYDDRDEGIAKWDYGAEIFQVFVLDVGDGSWKEIKIIGDDVALFVGDNTSFSIDISDSPGSNCLRGNSIYYTDDCRDCYYSIDDRIGGGKYMGIYNLLDGSFGNHFKDESSLGVVTSPMWVVPSFGLPQPYHMKCS